jgi:hypothetical protein
VVYESEPNSPKEAKMPQNAPNSRRGFLRSFLKDLVPLEVSDPEEERKIIQKVSVLALKFTKEEGKLTKIGVREPIRVDENLFTVVVSGHDSSGQTKKLKLGINLATREMGIIPPETEEEPLPS